MYLKNVNELFLNKQQPNCVVGISTISYSMYVLIWSSFHCFDQFLSGCFYLLGQTWASHGRSSAWCHPRYYVWCLSESYMFCLWLSPLNMLSLHCWFAGNAEVASVNLNAFSLVLISTFSGWIYLLHHFAWNYCHINFFSY